MKLCQGNHLTIVKSSFLKNSDLKMFSARPRVQSRRFQIPPGSRNGVVVRALASHQCVTGSIPRPGVICRLSLLLVLFLAPRGFSPGTPGSPQEPTFPNSNSIWIIVRHFIMSLWLGWSRKHTLCLTLISHLHFTKLRSRDGLLWTVDDSRVNCRDKVAFSISLVQCERD